MKSLLRERRRAVGTTASALVLLSAAVVGASPANAASYQRLIDNQTGRCLDSNSAGSVYTLPCNGGGYQLWLRWTNDSLRNYATGRCLRVNSSHAVQTVRCAVSGGGADESQWWNFYGRTVQNFYWGGCLDSNYAGSVYDINCNGGNYQNWHFG